MPAWRLGGRSPTPTSRTSTVPPAPASSTKTRPSSRPRLAATGPVCSTPRFWTVSARLQGREVRSLPGLPSVRRLPHAAEYGAPRLPGFFRRSVKKHRHLAGGHVASFIDRPGPWDGRSARARWPDMEPWLKATPDGRRHLQLVHGEHPDATGLVTPYRPRGRGVAYVPGAAIAWDGLL